MLLVLMLPACRDTDSGSGELTGAEWDPRPEFWVWNASPRDLDPAASAHALRWLAIEFPGGDQRALHRHLQRDQLPAERGVVPVFRLPAGTRVLDDEDYRRAVVRQLKHWFGEQKAKALELDYDCPTARLEDYAAWLTSLRDELGVERLSVTALASWVMAPEFGDFCGAVDELCPMFYDLEPDSVQEVVSGEVRPLVDESSLEWIGRWRRCPIPWRAGLPNYTRLSLFAADGSSLGHLHRWNQQALVSHPQLELQEGARSELQLLRALGDIRFADVSLHAGSYLIRRQPDSKRLIRAIEAAKEAGACGVIWFAHPASAPAAAYSVAHLEALQEGVVPKPDLTHHFEADGTLVLTNRGPGDVLPRSDGQAHVLTIEAEAQRPFLNPAAGEFSGISAGARTVDARMLRRIEWYYHGLPAGRSLRSEPGAVNMDRFY